MAAAVMVAAAAVVLVVRVEPSEEHEQTRQDQGTLRMVALLAEISAENDAPLPDASIPKPADPMGRFLLEEGLALDLLRAGETEKAVAAFQKLDTMLASERTAVPGALRDRLQNRLGVSYLRLGEQENCLLNHDGAACILPFDEAAIHENRRGSEAAAQHFSSLLERRPEDLSTRWLLNVAYMTLGGYPTDVPQQWLIPPDVFASEYEIKPFKDVAPFLGLDTIGLAGGSITEDFDADGDLDIMTSSSGPGDQLRYFSNDGDGTFSDLTVQASLKGITGGLNLIHADYNNDGYPDVFVLRGGWWGSGGRHPNSLLRNNGDGTFSDVTEQAGLFSLHPTQTAAWGDYDNDGWLDLFVGNESTSSEHHPCELFRNNGDGTFRNVAPEAGVEFEGYIKGVTWGDYDNDGRLDLYLSNFGGANALFHNAGPDSSGRWHFVDRAEEAGVGEPTWSFPTWFWDYDNDGLQDLLVLPFDVGILREDSTALGAVAAEYLGETPDVEMPRLYRNSGDGTFDDVTGDARMHRVMYAMGSNFGDIDNDGFQDAYIGTGAPDFRTLYPNLMLRNSEGKAFQDVTTSGRTGHLQKGHGVSFADLDHDGDQDIFTTIGGTYSGDLFQNALFENPGYGNRWITLLLEGTRSNRSAIGARLKLTMQTPHGLREIHETVGTGGSFGSSSLRQEIGLGDAQELRTIEIRWPSTGETQVFENVGMDRAYSVREGDSVLQPLALDPIPFDDSAAAAHENHDDHASHVPR